jgi:quercetin dioxygenase-like cupin family protein
MFEIDSMIQEIPFEGLTVVKLSAKEGCETLLISLEKGSTFPEHTSPRDTLLVVLEGAIVFSINNSVYQIGEYQTFTFPAHIKHKVYSSKNSKFLIIR